MSGSCTASFPARPIVNPGHDHSLLLCGAVVPEFPPPVASGAHGPGTPLARHSPFALDTACRSNTACAVSIRSPPGYVGMHLHPPSEPAKRLPSSDPPPRRCTSRSGGEPAASLTPWPTVVQCRSAAISATMRSVQVTAGHGHSCRHRSGSLYLQVWQDQEAGA